MVKPHSHSTSWRYACHRPINDTIPAVRPSPTTPTDRPTARRFQYGAGARRTERCSRVPPQQPARSRRISPFRPNGYSEGMRVIEPISSRAHPFLALLPTDYCSDRPSQPTSNEKPTVHVQDATPRNVLPDALVPGPLFRLFGHAKVQSEGFRFCNLILFFFNRWLHCLLEVASRSYDDPSSAQPIRNCETNRVQVL